ncbi:nuclear transport factor 2 family protein [uncultured Paludibaculum sp.]|uniref:nuclear transport factor 2 family protein n=1 Tax=uncultured Paludibaculum sp. TaxID=1765020 RepID=UPI002AAB49BC|nr:nuclear transport factor 2 family protein [uncultured Paludibaculum sp.]
MMIGDMLKNILFSLVILAVPAFCADDAAKAVEAAERAWAKGVTTNDYALLEKTLGDDLTYTHSTGAVDTKATYIGKLKTGEAKYVKVDHDQLKVQVLSKDTAITICRAQVLTVSAGKENPAHLSFLHIFQKRGGNWQLVAHQSAKLPN